MSWYKTSANQNYTMSCKLLRNVTNIYAYQHEYQFFLYDLKSIDKLLRGNNSILKITVFNIKGATFKEKNLFPTLRAASILGRIQISGMPLPLSKLPRGHTTFIQCCINVDPML